MKKLFVLFILISTTLIAQESEKRIYLPVFQGCEDINRFDNAALRICFQEELTKAVDKQLNHQALNFISDNSKRKKFNVKISFMVSKDGEITNIKNIDNGDNDFFLRVKSVMSQLHTTYKISPAVNQEYEAVNIIFKLPIVYKYNNKD